MGRSWNRLRFDPERGGLGREFKAQTIEEPEVLFTVRPTHRDSPHSGQINLFQKVKSKLEDYFLGFLRLSRMYIVLE